jgi:hypothetical protein
MAYLQTKNSNLGKFRIVWRWKMLLNVMAIIDVNLVYFWPFGIFCGYLVCFSPFWYVAPRIIWQPWSQCQETDHFSRNKLRKVAFQSIPEIFFTGIIRFRFFSQEKKRKRNKDLRNLCQGPAALSNDSVFRRKLSWEPFSSFSLAFLKT